MLEGREGHGGNDDDARDDLLDVAVDAEDVQTVAHDADDDDADDRAPEVGGSRTDDSHAEEDRRDGEHHVVFALDSARTS